MSCNPVTRGAGSSSLPASNATSAASGITDIDAAIASCFAGTLTATSDLNAWLQALAAQICTNASGITTLTASVATNAADIATNAAAIATNATNIATNVTNIAANTAAIAALDTRVDALEVPAGIDDGIAGGTIPYWDGTSWGGMPVADFEYDSAGGGAIFLSAPTSPDAILSLRATVDYTNIFEAQNTAGTSLAFAVPRATAVIGAYERDFFVQEAGTAEKGFVTKDRTSGTYKRIYVNNGAVAVENY